MKDRDREEFFNFLEGCGEVYNKPVKENQAEIFFNALADYEFASVEKAFNKHIRTNRFFPTPADIIGNMPSDNFAGHIGADEAWTLAVKAMDEGATVILNSEILQAREVAMDIYHSGDKVGARMAFRDAYNRITLNSGKPTWFVSLGHDKDSRESEIAKAYEAGLISYTQVKKYLPYTSIEEKPKDNILFLTKGN